MSHVFTQVDVFSTAPLLGNPLAVVHDADDLSDAQMAAFARWTNLSETTFLLTPTDPAADYRVRIFTPRGELPFAGHPTLGSAHAWLEDLFVLTEHRGQGLGKELLATLAQLCVDRGWTRLEWWVLDWNAPSIAFYESLGAVAQDEWTTYRLDGTALKQLGA